ncbi:MAG: Holliday junction resolvase RuvX [Bacteroidetes bacterium]|nr:Holliday junction resolvase RuvX [Bacteroidota bacterium]
MGRLLAIDYGSKRTGIAITDELKLIASGLTTVNTKELLKFLKKYFTSENVDVVLIGEPRQRDGTQSLIEVEIKKFVIILSEAFPKLKIVRVDERFTSKIALQTMIDSGLKKKQRQNKELIDEISATIILQDYLYKKK